MPNLPYLKIGGRTLAQGRAIMWAICEEAGRMDLTGSSPQQRVEVLEALGVHHDAYRAVVMTAYGHGAGTEMTKAFEETTYRKWGYLNKFIGDREWTCGTLTVADFVLFERLEWYMAATGGAFLDRFGGKKSNFYRIYRQFTSLPAVAAYLGSTRNQRPWFFNNNSAKWRGPRLTLGYRD